MAANRIFALIHGVYGVGKTTLGHTLPGPLLVFDTEIASRYVDRPQVIWDPVEEDVPKAEDLTNDTAVIIVCQDWESYRAGMNVLQSGDHPFRSVLIDSLTELQKRLKDTLNPVDGLESYSKPDWDVWDQLLVFMEKDVRKLRDLAGPGSRKPINVCILAASNVEEAPRRPILQGALKRSLPGFVDLEGYLRVVKTIDESTGKEQKRRVLDIDDTSEDSVAEVKCRPPQLAEKYGDSMWDPSFKKILRTINPTNKENTDG